MLCMQKLKNIDRRYVIAGLVMFVTVIVAVYPYMQARLRFALRADDVPVSSATPEDEPAPETLAPDTLVIGSLDIEAPILYVNEKDEAVFQQALRNGVVHYPGTALPGEPGNAYIFGHSSDYVWAAGDYKTVFALLPQIQIGTDIAVSNSQGEAFHYAVIETKVVGPRDLSVLDQFNNEKYLLTLQTSYPLGTALQRYIVVAELR
jgi:LPXTG-site transpeptidase (sortase) family protein